MRVLQEELLIRVAASSYNNRTNKRVPTWLKRKVNAPSTQAYASAATELLKRVSRKVKGTGMSLEQVDFEANVLFIKYTGDPRRSAERFRTILYGAGVDIITVGDTPVTDGLRG